MTWTLRPANWDKPGHPDRGDEREAILDQIESLTSPGWTQYTPVWTASTPPAIGNGTLIGRYRLSADGDIAHFIVRIVMGSTTTYGTGAWSIGFPTTGAVPSGTGYLEAVGYGTAFDSSSGSITVLATKTTSTLMLPNCSSTVPFTWATNDTLILNGFYSTV
jgi:hypothetical protein